MLKEAFKYPRKSKEFYRLMVLGGVLNFFKYLFFPVLFVYGYFADVLRTTVDGDKRPPRFEDGERLFVDGFKYLVIGMAYMLVPLLISMIGGPRGLAEAFSGFWGFLTFIVLVLTIYVLPVALTNFARKSRFRAGFDLKLVKKVSGTMEYLNAFVMCCVAYLAGGFITLLLIILLALTVLGAVLVPVAPSFVMFYFGIVGHRILAKGFKRAL